MEKVVNIFIMKIQIWYDVANSLSVGCNYIVQDAIMISKSLIWNKYNFKMQLLDGLQEKKRFKFDASGYK